MVYKLADETLYLFLLSAQNSLSLSEIEGFFSYFLLSMEASVLGLNSICHFKHGLIQANPPNKG
jgi:hypothetical protein